MKAQRYIHNVMLIDKRMIIAYMEELMIKLAILLKIAWVMEFAKANIKIEAHLV
jgi:hypothetical protein